MDGEDLNHVAQGEQGHANVELVMLTDHDAGNNVATTSQSISLKDPTPPTPPEEETTPEPQQGISRRRSARISSGNDQSGTISPSRRSPDARAKRASSRRELSSLSPSSVTVLSNLLAPIVSPEPSTSSGASLTSVLPSSFLNAPLPSTPKRRASPNQQASSSPVRAAEDVERTLIFSTQQEINKEAGPSGANPSDPPASPSRMSSPARRVPLHPTAARPGRVPGAGGIFGVPVFTAPPLEGSSRSPARRVPVKDMPFSATKLPRFGSAEPLGSNHADPNFTNTRPLDDPNRTPARRVKPSEFTSATKASRPPASPLKAPRFGSAEPQNTRVNQIKPPSKSLSDSETASPSKMRTTLPFPLRNGGVHRAASKLPGVILEEDEASTSSVQPPAPAPIPAKAPAPAARPAAPSSPAKSTLRQPTVTSKIPRIGAKPYTRPVEPKPAATKLLAPRKAIGNPAVCFHFDSLHKT